ncbi:MAG TPA: hypothetical protein GXZ29_08180, partial [Clostridiales bacterium]|nr:hypothetical protein [Clostridiales bacterium]
EGVYTLPVIYTMLDSSYSSKLEPYIGKKDLTDSDINQIGKLVDESGGLERSKKLALRYLDRCNGSLAALPNIPARDALRELVEELIQRRY